MRTTGVLAFVSLGLLAAILLIVVPTLWDGTNSYVDQNEDLLRTLPVYPGARQVSIESHPYYLRESGPVSGYGTLATFAVSNVSVEELLAYMEEHLPAGWTSHRQVAPCLNLLDGSACPSMVSLQAVNGTAFVGIDPANLGASLGSYDVYVDHDSHLADKGPAPASPAPRNR